ncbi:Mitoferrin [Orbilia brochopaga]|nr:Mitoferrin [Drechslerella brochopaga]
MSDRTGKDHAAYRGFVAGVFSGISKLTVGHPFDTIKVRLQTSPPAQFSGPLDCVLKTIRNEGIRGFYKGATPPLVGWMFMDSLMLGSLSNYRQLLLDIDSPFLRAKPHLMEPGGRSVDDPVPRLSATGHGIAGMFAGWTVSFIAAPIEHVKARLQVQYHGRHPAHAPRYTGPIDCIFKLSRTHGVLSLFHGLRATLLFRTFFFFWWSSYDIITRYLQSQTALSAPAVNFWAGGLSAQVFWITSYPSDVVKQRIMTDELAVDKRRYANWWRAARAIYVEHGPRGFWRGFLPCFLRAFPANAAALVAFETVMRGLQRIEER